MIKTILKKCLPDLVLRHLKTIWLFIQFIPAYLYDCSKYMRYSASNGYVDRVKLIGRIILEYHAIEKGLTMPDMRWGFGVNKLLDLIHHCEMYANVYDKENVQLLHAVGVVLEYYDIHHRKDYDLDPKILNAINWIRQAFPEVKATSQTSTTCKNYFQYSKSDFLLFSNSRSSVRNFSQTQDISSGAIEEALELARNTPSACNRQAWRSYTITDKNKILEILDLQGGNRGFGHLTHKLIIITAELGVFAGSRERHQAFVDGGMYLMNVLYALHYYEIAACPLNCCVDKVKDEKYRKMCHIKPSEVFISIIACGIPSDDLKIPASKRSELSTTNTVIDS